MKKILITDSLEKLKLKPGQKVEVYRRIWVYGEVVEKGRVVERYLDPA